MKKRHALILPYLCAALLLPLSTNICWAESFVATVKITLIDPENITPDQSMKFGPVKRLPKGKCTMDPKNGKLSGDACTATNAQTSVININGQKSLNIFINLNESSTPGIHFEPSLYNGQNQQNEFPLSTTHQAINLGGTLTQTPLSQQPFLQDTNGLQATVYQTTAYQAAAYNEENNQLRYDVDVIYP